MSSLEASDDDNSTTCSNPIHLEELPHDEDNNDDRHNAGRLDSDPTDLDIDESYYYYCRWFRYLTCLFLFWTLVLLLMSFHEDSLVIACMVLLGLWILYMLLYILVSIASSYGCCDSCWKGQQEQEQQRRRRRTLDAESLPMTDPGHSGGSLIGTGGRNFGYDNEFDDDGDDDNGDDDTYFQQNHTFHCSFDETPKYIKSCSKSISTTKVPKDGLYDTIFSAVFFGKPLRTEGKLYLTFQPHTTTTMLSKSTNNNLRDENNNTTKIKFQNGWQIHGKSIFRGVQAKSLVDGFVNAKGEIYWITENIKNPIVHRGLLNLSTCQLFDGEFSSSTGKHSGRIVRLELSKDQSIPVSTTTTTTDSSMKSFAATSATTTTNSSNYGIEMVPQQLKLQG